jgi:hypothetical protein
MPNRITSQTLALGLAAIVTAAMLAGVNHLAQPVDEQSELAQSGIDDAPVQQVVIIGHRVRS